MEGCDFLQRPDTRAVRHDENWHAVDSKATPPVPGLTDARSALSRVIEAEILPRLALAHQVQPHEAQDAAAPRSGDRASEHHAGRRRQRRRVRGVAARRELPHGRFPRRGDESARRPGGSDPPRSFCSCCPPSRRCGKPSLRLCRSHDGAFGVAAARPRAERSSRLEAMNWTDHRRVLLAQAPGDHTFGVAIVEKFFRSGWDVWGGAAGLAFDLPALVRHNGSGSSASRSAARTWTPSSRLIQQEGASRVSKRETGRDRWRSLLPGTPDLAVLNQRRRHGRRCAHRRCPRRPGPA